HATASSHRGPYRRAQPQSREHRSALRCGAPRDHQRDPAHRGSVQYSAADSGRCPPATGGTCHQRANQLRRWRGDSGRGRSRLHRQHSQRADRHDTPQGPHSQPLGAAVAGRICGGAHGAASGATRHRRTGDRCADRAGGPVCFPGDPGRRCGPHRPGRPGSRRARGHQFRIDCRPTGHYAGTARPACRDACPAARRRCRQPGDGDSPRIAMNISVAFIRRPVMTTVLSFALVACGTVAYLRLPVSELPNVDFPTISVSASLPGANPKEMAATVATPLERRLGGIAGLIAMSSASTTGKTTIALQFALSRNIDAAAEDVQIAISQSSRQLPPNMPTPPTLSKVNPADNAIVYLALTGDRLPLTDLDEYAETQ